MRGQPRSRSRSWKQGLLCGRGPGRWRFGRTCSSSPLLGLAAKGHWQRKASIERRANGNAEWLPILIAHRYAGYFLVTLEVIDAITSEAILNCASRFLIPCRRAIQPKSV